VVAVSLAGQDRGSARIGSTTVRFADHPSRDRAVMVGIVKELIFLLEHGKVARPSVASQAPQPA
jgi:hypothetical protein